MKKRIIIGSIIAVTILISISFTSVVGYNNIKSNSAINSPLFGIRTRMATEEESKDFTFEYVGKGVETKLLIPHRNDKNALIQKFINEIQSMDEETFNKFIHSIIGKSNQNKNNKEVKSILKQIRDNGKNNDTVDWPSWNNRRECTYYPCTIGAWFIGCWIFQIIGFFQLIIWSMIRGVGYCVPPWA
jgi:hypothetical protein